MQGILIQAIVWFARILMDLLLARAILSWFLQSGNSTVHRIYDILVNLTEPIVAPCRNLLSGMNTGMFDFSVLLAFFLIELVERALIWIVQLIF